MLVLLLLVPLLAALGAAAVAPQGLSRFIALAGSLASLALLPLVSSGTYVLQWFSSAGFAFGIVTSVSQLNLLLLAMVLGIAPLVMLYSFGFMDTLSQQRRFYAEMLAFEAAMALFAMSGSFITIFIAWEFLSLTSYLLIGFWNERESANAAARKAISIVLIGDMAMLAAIAVMAVAFKTLTFSGVIAGFSADPGAALVSVALLAVAALTKSAQLPFQEWLADAMEGPAPVSAFLHSTTMVKAGVFLIMLLLPMISGAGLAPAISVFGLITAAIATTNALKERQVKRVIAYSTVQELGLMIFAVASGAVIAGVFLFFAQSFYKALLFFSSGAMMKATDNEDITQISGLRRNRVLYVATIFGVLSLAGFVPFDGFFASSAIGSAFSANLAYYVILNAFGLLTSFYIFRWFLFTEQRDEKARDAVGFEAIPRSMSYSAAALGVATVLASLGVLYFMGTFRMPYAVASNLVIDPADAAIVTGIAVAGALSSYAVFRKRVGVMNIMANRVLYSRWLFNSLYRAVAAFVLGMASGAVMLERGIDSAFRGIGMSLYGSAAFVRRISYGEINYYVLTLSAAMVATVVLVYMAR
ncbi:MAG: hypothetical protein M1321_01610 [Candidatus Marsarchaeota archaeon]|nr:hypothetical protein [Candidatus Marsarchaeota archaeon]